jgi:Tol biopolymer transport system component
MIYKSYEDTALVYSNADGTGRINLYPSDNVANYNYYPDALTADGKRVFYTGYGYEDDSLMVGNPDYSGRRLLSVIQGYYDNLSVSPDGNWFAYLRPDYYPSGSIFVERMDGTDLHEVARDIVFWDASRIDWSPDSKRLVFAAASLTDPLEPGKLHIVNVDGSGLHNLSNDTLNQIYGVWSPDGTKIAVTRSRGPWDNSTYDIVTMNTDGTGVKVLVETGNLAPYNLLWSPDGTRILYSERDPKTGSGYDRLLTGIGALRAVEVATGTITTIAPEKSQGYWIR